MTDERTRCSDQEAVADWDGNLHCLNEGGEAVALVIGELYSSWLS